MHVQLDTGAEITCVAESTIRRIKHIEAWQSRNIRCVGNKKLGVFDRNGKNKLASFHIYLNKKRIWVDRAVVIDNFEGVLLGMPELDGLTKVDMVKKTVTFTAINEVVNYGEIENVAAVSTGDPLDEKNFEVDSRKVYKAKIDKMRKEAEATSTVNDVIFGEKVDDGLKKKLLSIMGDKKYKKVFAKKIGCLNSSFDVQAHMSVEIKEENVGPRRKSEKISDEKKKIIADNLDELFRDGVLVFPGEHGVTVKNVIPLMVVGKTNDDGEAIPLAQSARIVTQAHQSVNKWSKTPPMVTDKLATYSGKLQRLQSTSSP